MKITIKKLSEIKPYEKNPRKNDESVKYVAQSIKEFGFKVPIVIDRDGIIIAGHTRFKAGKKLNLKEVPCIVADDLTQEQIKAFRLADNKVSEKSEWDFNLLAVELNDILDIDMEQLGFDNETVVGDDFDTEFSLPDGDKPDICTMSFTLHNNQKQLIEYAIDCVKDNIKETFGNTNKNGNAIY